MPTPKAKFHRPGHLVVYRRGGRVGLVLKTAKAAQGGMIYEIGSVDGKYWILHGDLTGPRRGNFGDLVDLYDSTVSFTNRMAGLAKKPGAIVISEKLQGNLFVLLTSTIVKIANCNSSEQPALNRVMLDYGERAGFSEVQMEEGRAIGRAA